MCYLPLHEQGNHYTGLWPCRSTAERSFCYRTPLRCTYHGMASVKHDALLGMLHGRLKDEDDEEEEAQGGGIYRQRHPSCKRWHDELCNALVPSAITQSSVIGYYEHGSICYGHSEEAFECIVVYNLSHICVCTGYMWGVCCPKATDTEMEIYIYTFFYIFKFQFSVTVVLKVRVYSASAVSSPLSDDRKQGL